MGECRRIDSFGCSSARRGGAPTPSSPTPSSIPPLFICFTGHVSTDSRPIAIERGSVEDIAALRELWLELHHHHARVAPQSGEFVDDESSWRVRSSSYREWLAEPRSSCCWPGPRGGWSDTRSSA